MLSCKHSLALFVPAKPLNCAEQITCVRAWQLCTQACQGMITVAAQWQHQICFCQKQQQQQDLLQQCLVSWAAESALECQPFIAATLK